MTKLRLLLSLMLGVACSSYAQTPGTPTPGPGNNAGLLYASNFGLWQVPQGNTGQYSWSSPSQCTVTANSIPLNPVFKVGTPVFIKDANTANSEIVTPSAVNVSGAGCSITVSPTHPHTSFNLSSGTAGLQEAINYAHGLTYQVILTPDWARLGGTTGMITAAVGNANVSIIDMRTSCFVAYTWSGSGPYAAQPSFCATGPTGFPITLGSTSIAGSSTTTALAGLTVNNVLLDATGANTLFLNKAGGYTTPPGSGAGAATYVTEDGSGSPPTNYQVLTAGSGITLTPGSHTLTVASTPSDGVPFDPSNTRYVLTGTSFFADDTHVLGPTLTVTGGTCNGTACIVTNSGTNGFSAGDWAWVVGMTGWPAIPSPYGTGSFNNAPYSDIVQVISTGLSPTQFEFLSPVTATITGGSVYPANKFIPQQFSKMPFANGHGSIIGIFGANHNCFDVDTNYTAMFHSISPAVTGLPGYLIVNGCGNDIVSRLDSAATVEARLQSIWSKAHTDGWIVDQGTMIISSPGALVNGSLAWTTKQVNDWIPGQGQSYSTTTPYCTTDCGKNWDRFVDFYSIMSNLDAPGMFASNGGVGPGGAVVAANLLNESLVNKASSFKTQMAYSYFGFYSNVFPFNSGPGFIFSPPSVDDAFVVTTGDQNTVAFSVGTHAGRVGIQAADIIDNGLSPSTSPICPHGTNGKFTTSGCASASLSGMTAGQVPIAATSSTVTSSKALAGAGSAIVTGPASSTTGDVLTYADTSGTAQDSGTLLSSLAPKASPTFTGTPAAPTAAPGTNTTQLASTAFVQAAVTAAGTAFSGGLGTSFQDVTEIAAPANPAAGNDRLYTNSSTHKLACVTPGGADCMPTSSTGISGATSGQALIAGSATTATSSVALAGAGAGLTTGPVSGTTADHISTMNGTDGRIKDSGVLITAIPATDIASGALANGMTATTQSAADNSTKLATTAYVDGKVRQWSCQPGIGDGLNAITAGTYLQSTCYNTTGVTVTLTGLSCFTDNSGSSTMNAAGNTLGALLTGAVTCTSSFAAGTQSANVALTNGDYIKFTFVADGTSKQSTWVVKGTY